MSTFSTKFDKGFSLSSILTIALGLFAVLLVTDPAFAETTGGVGSGGDLEQILCNALAIVQGGVGKSIAAFAIIFIGVSLFLGKVSWGVAIATVLGIGAIFGATTIVEGLGAGGGSCDAGPQELSTEGTSS
ncbi:MAG: TrbC/VirB2 family protein [Rickettsiales bacterium]|jgi:type IV secretory pathway VirB2 component (pilin)|nr:TrbC/VirB2 family protein [Rickettsiales bacterium]